MAEPLKNSFGTHVIHRLAAAITSVSPNFDADGFTTQAEAGFDDLELTDRAKHVATALASHLPADRAEALRILIDSLDQAPPAPDEVQNGMGSFFYLPHVYFVADHGLDEFELAMTAQEELTQRFTAEFSIRSYLITHEADTLRQLMAWTDHDSEHVRRLVSEGSRPRLPWAPRLPRFIDDPEPVIELLERLKDDPSEYVRRSVANNLNDIAKDHPDRVVEVAEAWWSDDPVRQKMLRHGLRTLIKAGHPGALALLGYAADTPLTVGSVVVDPLDAVIGESTRVSVELSNRTDDTVGALVDLRVLSPITASSGSTTTDPTVSGVSAA